MEILSDRSSENQENILDARINSQNKLLNSVVQILKVEEYDEILPTIQALTRRVAAENEKTTRIAKEAQDLQEKDDALNAENLELKNRISELEQKQKTLVNNYEAHKRTDESLIGRNETQQQEINRLDDDVAKLRKQNKELSLENQILREAQKDSMPQAQGSLRQASESSKEDLEVENIFRQSERALQLEQIVDTQRIRIQKLSDQIHEQRKAFEDAERAKRAKSNLEDRIKQLEGEITTLEAKNGELEIGRLRGDLDKMDGDFANYRNQSDRTMQDLTEKLKALKDEKSQVEDSYVSWKVSNGGAQLNMIREIDHLKNQVAEGVKEIQRLKEQNENVGGSFQLEKNKVIELTQALRLKEDEALHFQTRYKEIKTQLDGGVEYLKKLESNNRKFSQEADEARNQLRKVKRDEESYRKSTVAALEDEKNRLELELQKLQSDNKTLSKKADRLDETDVELTKTQASLRAKEAELIEEKKNLEKIEGRLLQETGISIRAERDLKNKLDAMRSDNQQSRENLTIEIDSLNAKISTLQSQLATEEETVEGLRHNNGQIGTDFVNKLNVIRQEKKVLEGEIERLRQELAHNNVQNKEVGRAFNQKIQQLQQSLQAKDTELAQLAEQFTRERNKFIADYSVLQNQKKSVTESFTRSEQASTLQLKQIQSFRLQVDQLKQELETTKSRPNALSDENRNLSRHLEELRQNNQQLDDLLKQEKAISAKLQSQLAQQKSVADTNTDQASEINRLKTRLGEIEAAKNRSIELSKKLLGQLKVYTNIDHDTAQTLQRYENELKSLGGKPQAIPSHQTGAPRQNLDPQIIYRDRNIDTTEIKNIAKEKNYRKEEVLCALFIFLALTEIALGALNLMHSKPKLFSFEGLLSLGAIVLGAFSVFAAAILTTLIIKDDKRVLFTILDAVTALENQQTRV